MPEERPLPPAFANFDHAYAGIPPWEIGKAQPALAALFDTGQGRGPVLDVGCGTGELALLAASRGLDATGIDSSPRAIAIARQRATERGISHIRLEVGDALDLSFLGTIFDTVLDSGVFHVFSDDDRAQYLESIRQVLAPAGRYHLLVFSDAQPGDWGPRRVRREEFDAAFASGWTLQSVQPSSFELSLAGEGARAWLATAVRN